MWIFIFDLLWGTMTTEQCALFCVRSFLVFTIFLGTLKPFFTLFKGIQRNDHINCYDCSSAFIFCFEMRRRFPPRWRNGKCNSFCFVSKLRPIWREGGNWNENYTMYSYDTKIFRLWVDRWEICFGGKCLVEKFWWKMVFIDHCSHLVTIFQKKMVGMVFYLR